MVDSAPYLPLISSLLHLYLRSTASYIQDAFRNAEALQNESVKITLDFFFYFLSFGQSGQHVGSLFPHQGLNWGVLRFRQILYHVGHKPLTTSGL